jgi:hypothetical protein
LIDGFSSREPVSTSLENALLDKRRELRALVAGRSGDYRDPAVQPSHIVLPRFYDAGFEYISGPPEQRKLCWLSQGEYFALDRDPIRLNRITISFSV